MPLAIAPQVEKWATRLLDVRNLFQGAAGVSVGLDLGSSLLKGVKLSRKEGRYRLVRTEVGVVPLGSKPAVHLAALQALLGRLDVREARIVTAVAGSGVVLRSVMMPKMSPQELRGAFTYEAEKYIPFKPEEAFLDFSVLGQREGGRMEVLLAAARRDLVMEHLEPLHGLGVFPSVVDLETVALANAWEIGSRSGEAKGVPGMGLLHVGARATVLDFLSGTQLQFAREIPVGGNVFTQAVAAALHVDLAEAEKIKCDPGKRAEQVQAALGPYWESWLNQCRVSFDFYESQFGRAVERLVLSGGSVRLAGFREWIESTTGLPTEAWNPLVPLERDGGTETQLPVPQGAFAVAVGLAVRGCQ